MDRPIDSDKADTQVRFLLFQSGGNLLRRPVAIQNEFLNDFPEFWHKELLLATAMLSVLLILLLGLESRIFCAVNARRAKYRL